MGARVILLDTSVLIALDAVTLPDDLWAISALSHAELAFGARVAATAEERARRRHRLSAIEATGLDWLPFDRAAGDGYATVAEAVWRTRRAHARSTDIMIAGHAHALGATLATLNPVDFDLVRSLVPVIVPGRT
jgi:predicted nucleic acid-binding protein